MRAARIFRHSDAELKDVGVRHWDFISVFVSEILKC